MGSNNLKRHCKTVHGLDNEQYKRMKIKIYSCKYCKKPFARSINCLYHELHCQPREAGAFNLELEQREMVTLKKFNMVATEFVQRNSREGMTTF